MKILSPIGSLTLAATMLLQLGSFANAMPTFTDTSYLADAEACADFRITYPSATGLSFEDSSNHVVAWQIPKGANQVNITLIENSTQNTKFVGLYPASQGSSEEFPFLLGSNEGDYHFHAESYGGTTNCEADSVDFKINKRAAASEDASTTTTDSSDNESQDSDTASNVDALNSLLDAVKESQASGQSAETHDNRSPVSWEDEKGETSSDSNANKASIAHHVNEELDNLLASGSLTKNAGGQDQDREVPGPSDAASPNWQTSPAEEPASSASPVTPAKASEWTPARSAQSSSDTAAKAPHQNLAWEENSNGSNSHPSVPVHKDATWDAMLDSLQGYTDKGSASPSHSNAALNEMLDQLQASHKNAAPATKAPSHSNAALNEMLDQLQASHKNAAPATKAPSHPNKAMNEMLDQLQASHKNAAPATKAPSHSNAALNEMLDQLQASHKNAAPATKAPSHSNAALNEMLDQLQASHKNARPATKAPSHPNKAMNEMLDELQKTHKNNVGTQKNNKHENKALNEMLDALGAEASKSGRQGNDDSTASASPARGGRTGASDDDSAVSDPPTRGGNDDDDAAAAAADISPTPPARGGNDADADADGNDISPAPTAFKAPGHKNGAENTAGLPTFEEYIKSLDQDFKPIIENSRASESEAVTHQNEAGSIDEINSRLEKALNLSVDSVHEDGDYFTNTDQRTKST